MGWSEKYKKSIDCSNPKGFSQKAHCQGRKKKMNEDLRKWFGKGGEGGVGGGGWDRYNTKGERIGKCAREPGEGKPKCLSKEKAAKMSKDEIAAAVKRKRESDPVADRPGKGGKPKMVSNKIDEAKGPCWTGYKQVGMKKKGGKQVPNCVPEHTGIVGKILEQIEGEEQLKTLEEKNVPTNPSLWSKMKSRAKAKFDVYPSAYANGWAAKEYKKAGGGWKSVNEEEEKSKTCKKCKCNPCECEDGEDDDKEEMNEAVRMPAKTGNIVFVMLSWRGKIYSLQMFFPTTKLPSRSDVEDQVKKIYPDSRVTYFKVRDFEPGQPLLQVSEGAAWTRKEGQNKKGGLNEKGRKSYERENPGSDLKAPSKKVGNPRRSSFCARMKGMKKKLTSSKTANDPDSRINKSLRAWNC